MFSLTNYRLQPTDNRSFEKLTKHINIQHELSVQAPTDPHSAEVSHPAEGVVRSSCFENITHPVKYFS